MTTDHTQPQLLDTDGPMTCIWKIMDGQDWLSSPEIMDLLEAAHCKYSRVTLRNRLGAMSHEVLESRPLPERNTKYNSAKQYRLIPGRPMPDNLDPKIKRPATALKNEEAEERQRKGMDEAVNHMSSMMMAFVKPKNVVQE